MGPLKLVMRSTWRPPIILASLPLPLLAFSILSERPDVVIGRDVSINPAVDVVTI